MNKISASILVFLALFALVGAEKFQTLNFDQGRLRFRSLDTTSTLKSFSYVNHTNTTSVNVNLGTAYNTKAAIDTTITSTDMMVLLSGSTTAFCTDCNVFVKFQCASNDCAADTTKYQQTFHPFYYAKSGHPFTINVTIGADATAWQLKNTALLYTYYDEQHNTFTYPGQSMSPYYIQNYTNYGFIGMGVDGDSVKNFVGDHPLFSVTVNGSGSGQLIFGKDTTKIDSSRTALSVNSDTNWTMLAKNISLGTSANWKNLPTTTNVIFDLNFPGLGIPYTDTYTDFMNNLTTKHNVDFTDKVQYNTSTYENSQYPYIYKGDLANLDNIVIGLSNGQNLTIPPQAYTRKLADGIYNILINYVSNTYNYDTKTSASYFVVLGWSVMSNFYTVFEKTATGNPTITLNPTYATTTTGTTTTTTSSWKTILIIVVVVLVALVVISMAAKKKNALTKSDLGVELRAARV